MSWGECLLIGLIVILKGKSTVDVKRHFRCMKNFFLQALIMSLVMWEVMWVMHFLPLGYLSLGALVAWLWYLLQLFVRFHLSKQGVVWKKQIIFLLSNLVLYFSVLYFFVRWI